MSTTKAIDLQKHIREGWRVRDFIDSLAPEVERIMSGRSWRKPFTSKQELAAWCRDNQPYYKKRYERTIKSHMSYDNCLLTLQANDLSQVCNILLLHLSDNNSNATEFIHGIERLYPEIEITAATNGLSLTFNKNPY